MKSALPGASRTLPLLLAAASLALSLALARSLPLVDPDEGRNAEVAREMAVTGDVVIPHLAGMPYLDKPPGLFWTAALAIRLAGRVPWAVRLPAGLSAALLLWIIAELALRRADAPFAWRASLLLMSAPLFAVMSAYVIFDMPLALCVTALWTRIADEVEQGASLGGRLVMFAAVTAGILIKGPVMLAWALGGSLGAAAMLRSRAPLRWLLWPAGWGLVLALAGGWFLAASLRHPEYPRYAFLEESLERLSSGTFHRDQPWWFVPAVLIGGALPWSISTAWRLPRTTAGKIALGFLLFAVVFFTFSRSKLVTYLVPALPPLAWLATEAWSDPRRAGRGIWILAAFYAMLSIAGFAIIGGVMGPALQSVLGDSGRRGVLMLSIGFGLLAVMGIAIGRSRPALGFVGCLAFTPMVLMLGYPLLARQASAESGEGLARAIAAAAPGASVRYEFCYSPGTDFLLGRTSTLVSPRGLESTSNYQVRYRTRLIERGSWKAVDDPGRAGPAGVIVRGARDPRPAPAGAIAIFRDHRFVAYRTALALAAGSAR